MERICKRHGFTAHRLEGKAQHLRCIKCRSERITLARQRLKVELVNAMGGKCQECGYSKSTWALGFHHRDRADKKSAIGALVRDRKRAAAFDEIKKCILLCANCHGEIEEKIYGDLAQW